MVSITRTALLLGLVSKALAGGCLGDIPPGRLPYYDHSGVIPPYKDPSQISFSAQDRALMQLRLDQFIGITTTQAPPSKEFTYADFSVNYAYYGSAGRALTFWKLYLDNRGKDTAKAAQYLALAKDYIDGSVNRMRFDQENLVGFLEGNNGIYAIASVIYDTLGEPLLA